MTYAHDPTTADPAPAEESGSRRGFGCLLEIVETLVLTLVIYLLIHNFIAQPFEVDQESMLPTINPHEYVLIDKLSPRFDDYHRGDIVVFQPPEGFGVDGGIPFIKRVIGLPGDVVSLENGRVFVTPPGGSPVPLSEPYVRRDIDNGPVPTQPRNAEQTTEWTVPPDTFFVLGDNRTASQDSRAFGPIDRDLIVGRAWLRYFPLDRIGLTERPVYERLPDQAPSAETSLPLPRQPYPRGGSSATIQVSMARS